MDQLINLFSKNKVTTNSPLFLNLKNKKGTDFKLFGYIQQLKLNYTPKQLINIIIIPGIGISPIFVKYNKSSTSTIKSLDSSGRYQQNNSWACKQVQETYTKVWPNINIDECIKDVLLDPETDSKVEPAELDYSLIDSLKAYGYQIGKNLHIVPYDFRTISNTIDTWCVQLSKLIEDNGTSIIIGHDLGAVLANYFLVNSLPEWKNHYINKFISVSGAFGGCQKAVDVYTKGETNNKYYNQIVKQSSALELMMPNNLYKISQSSNKIITDSMKSPGTTVYVLAGSKIDMSGDGTMSAADLEKPLKWAYTQQQPVYVKFFDNAEHTEILSMYEPVKYIMELI